MAAAVAAVGGICASSAQASDNFWNNPLGGSFHLDANWSGGVPNALEPIVGNGVPPASIMAATCN